MKRPTFLFACIFAFIAATPQPAPERVPTPDDALASIGVSMDVPAGFVVQDVAGYPRDSRHAAMVQLVRGDAMPQISISIEDVIGRTAQQVAQEMGAPFVQAASGTSRASKVCNGVQDGWAIDYTGPHGILHQMTVVSATREATAQVLIDRATPDGGALAAALETMCLRTPSTPTPLHYVRIDASVPATTPPPQANASSMPTIEQLLASIGVSATLPANWMLVDGAAPHGMSGGAVVFMLQGASNTANVHMIAMSTDELKGGTLRSYVSRNLPSAHAKISHAQRMCSGTQNGWVIETMVQRLSVHAALAVKGSRVAVMQYMHDPSSQPNSAALHSLDTLCAK